MRVFTKKPFVDAASKYPNDRVALMDVYRILKNGSFETPEALRNVVPSLDNFKHKPHWYVIDIGGNNLRLLAAIYFSRSQRMYVKYIVPHAEYDKLTRKAKKGDL